MRELYNRRPETLIQELFAAPEAGWSLARYHRPDVMIAASNVQTLLPHIQVISGPYLTVRARQNRIQSICSNRTADATVVIKNALCYTRHYEAVLMKLRDGTLFIP